MWREGWLDSTTFPPAPPTPAPPPPPGPPPPPHPQVCQPPSNTPPVSSSYTFLHGGAGVISNNGALFWLCSGSVLALFWHTPCPQCAAEHVYGWTAWPNTTAFAGSPFPQSPLYSQVSFDGLWAACVQRSVQRKTMAANGRFRAAHRTCASCGCVVRVANPPKSRTLHIPSSYSFQFHFWFLFPQVREREGGGGHVLPCVVQGGRGLLDVHGRAGGRPRLRQPGRRHRCHHHPRQVQGRARCLLGRSCCRCLSGRSCGRSCGQETWFVCWLATHRLR